MKLPELICGPIIRRATRDQVTFWLATSKSMRTMGKDKPDFHVELFTGPRLSSPLPTRVSEAEEVQLGKRLFVSLVTVVAEKAAQLPAETVIGYDIKYWEPVVKAGTSLISPIANQLALENMRLPSFILQRRGENDLRALYGSCRKLHGPGPDMMVAAEKRLQETRSAKDRPSVLFLGGDQIYADDVSDVLLPEIKKWGRFLMGRYEEIPDFPKIDDIPPRARQRELQQRANFTSDAAHNHLLTFGEYAAIYLLAWNVDLWPTRSRSFPDPGSLYDEMEEEEKEQLEVSANSSATWDPPDPRDFFIESFEEQKKNLALARKGARSARKVLANIATYMIFDDHEITDDWYLNVDWRDKVLKTRPGKRVIANGLAAYWAFQGWGNAPQEFDQSFRDNISSFLVKGNDPRVYEDTVINFVKWSYIAPTSPPTLVLNTRTRRTAPANAWPEVYGGDLQFRDLLAPRLFDSDEEDRLRGLLDGIPQEEGQPLMVVAPTPIFGVLTIEELTRIQIQAGKSRFEWDFENWSANPRSFVDFVELMREVMPSSVIILSGDVHYGFEIWALVKIDKKTIPVIQLCSSAMKNHPVRGSSEANGLNVANSSAEERQSRHPIIWRAEVSDEKSGDGPVHRLFPHENPPWYVIIKTAKSEFETFSKFPRDSTRTFSAIGTPSAKKKVSWPLINENNLGEVVVDGSNVYHRSYVIRGGVVLRSAFI